MIFKSGLFAAIPIFSRRWHLCHLLLYKGAKNQGSQRDQSQRTWLKKKQPSHLKFGFILEVLIWQAYSECFNVLLKMIQMITKNICKLESVFLTSISNTFLNHFVTNFTVQIGLGQFPNFLQYLLKKSNELCLTCINILFLKFIIQTFL